MASKPEIVGSARRAAGAAGLKPVDVVPSPVPARGCTCWHFVWHSARESSRGSDGYLFFARARVVLRDFLRDCFEAGTLAPFSRASLSPMATACLRLVTFRPEPLLRVPFFFRRIADATVFDADFPVLRHDTLQVNTGKVRRHARSSTATCAPAAEHAITVATRTLTVVHHAA